MICHGKLLNPTIDETREVVGILLKELETFQLALEEKDKVMEMYQNVGPSVDTKNHTLKTRIIQENMQLNSTSEIEIIDDEIEVLEVVKESIDENIYLDLNIDSNLSDKYVIENDVHYDRYADESVGEVGNEW